MGCNNPLTTTAIIILLKVLWKMMMFAQPVQALVRTVMIPMLTNCLPGKLMEESYFRTYLMTGLGPDTTKDHCNKISKNMSLSDIVYEAILCNLNPCLQHSISFSKDIVNIIIISLNFNSLYKLCINNNNLIIQITIRINRRMCLPIKLLLILVHLLD